MTTRTQLKLALTSVVLVAVGVFVASKVKQVRERDERYRERVRQLREQYPFESLATRLPGPPRVKGAFTLAPAAGEQLQKFETSIENENATWGREESLRKLHEGSVDEFVSREGFGVARLFSSYHESVLAQGHQKEDGAWVGRNKTSVAQPSSIFADMAGETNASATALLEPAALLALHFRNLLHFANPAGFGVVKERRQVAGFQPHQFNELLEDHPWKIMRLELIGLLRDDGPQAYVTDALPRMQDLSAVPTRGLDAFEVAGLEKLQAGDELFVRDVPGGIRMLGSIRSARQCLTCHDGERGDLLGVFSYGLRRGSTSQK